jgi:hypothetical protein
VARNDIKVLKNNNYGVFSFRVDDRTATSLTETLKEGDAVIKSTGGFVGLLLTAMPTQGTDIFVGITKTESNETSTANGTVNVEVVGPGTILRGKANTATNIDTDAKLLPLIFDYVNFDRSAATVAGSLTIDEDEGDTPGTLALCIFTGDIVKGTLDVAVANSHLWIGTV